MSQTRYRDLFHKPEFSALFVADVLSITGTFLARIAVAALVYDQTGSTTFTAIAFAVSYAPYVFSPWLSTFADIWPRRRILILCDLARGVCIGLIVIPGFPLGIVVTLLFLEALFRVPWGAARLALLSEILTDELFPAGNALVSSTRQALQVGGFAVGGVVVAVAGARPTLAIDAVTYVLSAAIIAVAVRPRPAPWVSDVPSRSGGRDVSANTSDPVTDGPPRVRPSSRASMMEGLRICVGTPGMPQLFMLLALGPAVVVITEGLAVPFADEIGGGVALAGIIMAAPPLGTVVGLFFFGRLAFETQRRLVAPFAIASPMAVAAAGGVGLSLDAPAIAIALLALAGACLCYLSAIQSEIAANVVAAARGRVFGLANATLQLAQGGAIVVGGLIASSTSVAQALVGMALAGALTIVVMVGLSSARSEVASRAPESGS